MFSRVGKKNCPNFLYWLYKPREIIFPFILGRFSFISNATNFFIHSLNRFLWKKKNCLRVARVLQLVPYMQISDMILEVNIISRKVSVASFYRAGGLGVFWEPREGFRGWSTLTKFLGSKEHLDWFKIDFNATKIITVQDYNKKVHVNGSTHSEAKAKARSQTGNIWVKHMKT